MKNKGITLISLIITVVILGIIGTVTIYSGTKAITSARLKRFSAEMEIIRLKCNELLEEGITIEDLLILGQEIEILSEDKLSKINNALQQVTSSADTQGYVYFDKHGLRNLGIVSIDREVIINFDEKVIIDINGVKNENDEYIYTINWTSNAVLATNVPLQSIALDNTSYTLTIGRTFTLTPIITPSNASNKKITWTSSDDSIATVAQNGVVKGISKGNATITVTTEDGGKLATCVVTVEEPKIELNKTELTLEIINAVNAEEILVATLKNLSGTVSWTSSAPTIATVDSNGKVTTVGVGTTTITASCGGYIATCKLKVESKFSFIVEHSMDRSNYPKTLWAKQGMTWEQWCNDPEFNTEGYVIKSRKGNRRDIRLLVSIF